MSSIESSDVVLRRSERIKKREAARPVLASVRHEQTTSSCSTVLPDDLMVEVLHRLPPKPFFHFQKALENWLPLFSAAAPLNKHLQPNLEGFFYNKRTSGLGFANLRCWPDKVEFDGTISELSCHGALRIHDSCNGFLLVEVLNEKFKSAHNMYVYNPATWTSLGFGSFPKENFHGLLHQEFSLAFDPKLYPEFNIISFSKQANQSGTNFIEIYSFDKGECKHCTKLLCEATIKEDSWGTFVDGRVHRQTGSRQLLSVDPKDCSYEVTNLPYLEKSPNFTEIVQSQRLLHCIAVTRNLRLFIWSLESCTSKEWTLKYQLSLFKIYSYDEYFNCLICERLWTQAHIIFHPKKDTIFMPLEARAFLPFDLSTGTREDELGAMSKTAMGRCWYYMGCYLA